MVKLPVLDTGIGIEAGYRSDAEFIQAAEAQRQARLNLLRPDARSAIEAVERDVDERMERHFLYGDDA